jgi:hypothetical protein
MSLNMMPGLGKSGTSRMSERANANVSTGRATIGAGATLCSATFFFEGFVAVLPVFVDFVVFVFFFTGMRFLT